MAKRTSKIPLGKGEVGLSDLTDSSSSQRSTRQSGERDPRISVEYHTRRASLQLARKDVVTEDKHGDLSVDYHIIDFAKLFARLGSSQVGLSEKAARSVLATHGRNEIKLPSQLWSKIRNFLLQFVSGFAILLWIAALFCFLAWQPFGGDPYAVGNLPNLTLALLIIVVILIQVGFNLYQEWTSSRVMASITKLMPAQVKVYRDENLVSVPAAEIVPGDVIQLTLGDAIPADLRLLKVDGLKVDASILTGESLPINCTVKCTAPDNYLESKNVCFMGTNVVEGSGTGMVVNTGLDTLMGRITLSASSEKQSVPPTALALEIRKFVLVVGSFAFGTGAIVLLAWGLWLRVNYPLFLSVSGIIVNAIGCIVAYVPEGLPICMTSSLTIIAKRMGRKNVLVKSLPVVETLGTINVLCTDKTGTLTTGKMSAYNVILSNEVFRIEKDAASLAEQPLFQEILKVAGTCNRASYQVQNKDNSTESVIVGDSSDTALFSMVEKFTKVAELRQNYKKQCEIPFNSRNKWMLSIFLTPEGNNVLMMKGAPDILLSKCKYYFDTKGSQCEITPEFLEKTTSILDSLGAKGERILAFVERPLDNEKFPPNFIFDAEEMNFPIENLTLVGFISLIDPPRKETARTIQECHSGGIRVTMITGDHQTTGAAIAESVGIISGPKLLFEPKNYQQYKQQEMGEDSDLSVSDYRTLKLKIKERNKILQQFYDEEVKFRVPLFQTRAVVVKGSDIEHLNDDMWDFILSHTEVVFARTTPEQKLKIVQQYQKCGNVVAVTGDGVNDSPALRQANIGVAMGGGTDVAREAADIILMDDNISSILVGILNGRLVFENLKKVIGYLIQGGCWCEMLTIIGTIFFGLPVPLSGFLMVFISVFTDVANSVTMTYEHAESDLMKKPPRSITGERLVDWKLIFQSYVFLGTIQSIGAWILWFSFMASAGLSPGQLVFAFDRYIDGFAGKSQAELNLITAQGQCVYFVALVGSQLGNRLAMRSRDSSILQHNPFSKKYRNWKLFLGMFISYMLAVIVVNIPAFNTIVGTAVIPAAYWFLPFITALVIVLVDELRKLGKRRYPKYFFWW